MAIAKDNLNVRMAVNQFLDIIINFRFYIRVFAAFSFTTFDNIPQRDAVLFQQLQSGMVIRRKFCVPKDETSISKTCFVDAHNTLASAAI